MRALLLVAALLASAASGQTRPDQTASPTPEPSTAPLPDRPAEASPDATSTERATAAPDAGRTPVAPDAERVRLRREIAALTAEVQALSSELAAAREEVAEVQRQQAAAEEARVEAAEQRATSERAAEERRAALEQSTQELGIAERSLAGGDDAATAELQRAHAALTGPGTRPGPDATEAARLLEAALGAIQRDSLYEARVLVAQAARHAQAARASAYPEARPAR